MSEQLISAKSAIKELREKFPDSDCRTDKDSKELYGQDWTRFHKVDALAIIFPRVEADIQWLVKFASMHQLALVPSGGRTGLSAAAVATQGEIIISLEQMDKILEYNPEEATVRCQAGVITANLQEFAKQKGMFYPVDFAASGSSQIGGNVATNAGGIRVVRYGMTRDQVVGLKVVTGTGELLDLNKGLLKNATGYDLRHLFIGSEGTLGIITEVTVKLSRPPGPQSVILLGLDELSALLPIMMTFRESLLLSAYEFFSDQALDKVMAHQKSRPPFDSGAAYYALLEVDMNNPDCEDTLIQCFEHVIEQGWVVDGVISSSDAQASALWKLREGISEAITPWTPYKIDISVTLSKVPEFLQSVESKVVTAYPDFEHIWFGHIGDGNLHLNILKPESMDIEIFKQTCHTLSDMIYAEVERFEGSISAEHGIGLLKKQFLHHSRSNAEISLMKGLKSTFDPAQIMNPGKVF